jgi:hypothetical protein
MQGRQILCSTSNRDKSLSLSHDRFRLVPTFGDGVIRMFANNTSEMKRLAARDFEDILQVSSRFI